MTHAIAVYDLLSSTIEPAPPRRASLERPELAFGRIGIAAVAAALAASRPASEDRRPALAPQAPPPLASS